MTLETVRAQLARCAPDLRVIVTEARSATVAEAAAAHGVAPERIAKTLCLRAGGDPFLLLASGTARLDNRKVKDRFGAKPRMLDAAETEALTSHPVGGVCPFGLPAPMTVHCDESLRPYDEVIPAAGAPDAALRIATDRLLDLTGADWIDLCK
jgi:prolyl-tRNA editing enzyme YbaK/EbsC (Cys-tRNA(Pro) deacylase)